MPNFFWFVLLLYSTKVYYTLSQSSSSAPSDHNPHEKGKVSNYFLHQPYGPDTYAFGYEVEDPETGNVQFRDERRYVNGSIEGNFGYVRPDGLIEVTNYRSAKDVGYQSQTQTYAAGDERAAAVWPLKKPDILVDRSNIETAKNVSWDEKRHLNISAPAVSNEVEDKLRLQHGLDLNHLNMQKNVLAPGIRDIVNGKVPLKKQLNRSMGFETVHNVIPKDFPIVPFELPSPVTDNSAEITQMKDAMITKENSQTITDDPVTTTTGPIILEDASTKPDSDMALSKYDKAKSNNDEKSLDLNTELPPPKPLINSASQVLPNWYEKIIQANRREFLENLPNLKEVETQ